MISVLSKKLITAYYGQGSLKYSYWNGCSTGGRQGLMMAQRYPGDYDGVVAGSSAIHWDKFQVWRHQPRDRGRTRSRAGLTVEMVVQDDERPVGHERPALSSIFSRPG